MGISGGRGEENTPFPNNLKDFTVFNSLISSSIQNLYDVIYTIIPLVSLLPTKNVQRSTSSVLLRITFLDSSMFFHLFLCIVRFINYHLKNYRIYTKVKQKCCRLKTIPCLFKESPLSFHHFENLTDGAVSSDN